MKIYNTLSRSIEEFKPLIDNQVKMYTCGPTVYDRMHVGNLRTFVLSDVLERALKLEGFKVESVQNITDVDDKIIKRAIESKKDLKEIADEFTKYFIDDVNKLNINWNSENQPKVSDYIEKIANYVKVLQDKGFAYEKDGSVYFDISKFEDYGKLSGIKNVSLKTGTRVLSDEYTKDDVQDFALWKHVPEGELGSFESSLGWGRPGWHIECSVMSQDKLGDTIDIHLGGVDLIFPHHENEIAQSEAKTGKQFSRFFVHGAHMLVDGKKMSKSLKNFYTLDDIIAKGIEPLALRYLYFQTHWRQEMNFTWEALSASQNALNRLKRIVSKYDDPKIGCAELEEKFKTAVNNDLNMPQALAVAWETVNSDYPSSAKKRSLLNFDEMLGLGLNSV
ncbi:MAG: cysteine--tRNA ligase [Candidatus Levybacteria bacterium RIFCSPLOWO2_01_FULL_36_13]|nr:MAG: cysteine--tRNA ligase [Candidatus Levybacteria bacterium RIFCSPHIGHO2_01_FULL_36_15b]OGH35404.1 MAG: cysteine--tRNA ligase [Candidatus Levybacteria bacterium RIFCSPLOWO2_01_FULL_36_13]